MSDQPIPIKWGDVVRIHGVSYKKGDQIKGLIIAKGFTDPNIYYQKYQKFDDVSFYRESLFQIWPRGNFDMHDLLCDQKTKQEDKDNIRTIAKNQTDNLEKALQNSVGKIITYGSQFILKHMESKGYLEGSFDAADVGQGAFMLKIVDTPSSKVNFRFTSHRSYQQEGHKIFYDDQLQIYNPNADCYMNYSEFNQPIYLDQDKDIDVSIPPENQAYKFFKARPSIKKPKGDRIAVLNQNKSKCLWKMILHCTYSQSLEKKNIISHDIVYFQHTKKNGLISSTLADKKSYLKQFQSGSSISSISYQCFWELTPKSASQFGPQSCKIFRARNVVTGQLLTYGEFQVQVKAKQKSQSGFLNRSMVQMICSKPQNQKEEPLKLQRGQVFQKEGDTPKIVEYFQSKISKLSLTPVQQLPQDSFLIKIVDQQTTSNIMYALSAHQPIVKFLEVISTTLMKRHDRDFEYKAWFLSLNQSFLIKLIYILRCLSQRIYACSYDEIQSSGNVPNPIVQKILVETGIAQLLIECLYHLHDPFIYIQAQRSNPAQDKSVRNKIQQIFENCYKLLYRIAANNQQNRIYMSRWVQMLVQQSNNINRSYIQLCILGMLQNNPVSIKYTINQKTIMNLAGKFFQQVKKLDQNTELPIKYLRLFSTVIKCEDQVIKQNQLLVLKHFFNNQHNQLTFRFRVQYKEQMEEQEQPGDILAKIRSRQVHIAFGREDFMPIPQFFVVNKFKWNYFLAYVDLLADVCMDRNSQAIEFVTSIISLQAVIVILFDTGIETLNAQIKELDNPKPKAITQQSTKKGKQMVQEQEESMTFPINNVHKPFIRIAHHLYVNNQKFNPIQSIGKISDWYAHQDFQSNIIEQINKTKRVFEGQTQEQEKRYLQNLLHYIKNFLEGCNQDPFNLTILETVLDLLQVTITLGLWQNMYSFKQLIPFLIMKITKIENKTLFYSQKQRPAKQIVAQNKQALTLSRPQITNLIKCKIKATNIFRLANQLQIDIRLRYLMNFFRGVYKCTQDFQKYNLEEPEFDQNMPKQILDRNKIAGQAYMQTDQAKLLGGAKKLADDVDILMKPNIWYHKLKQLTPFKNPKTQQQSQQQGFNTQKIMNRYLFSDVQKSGWCQFGDIVLALFELPAYQNIKLINNSLKMLRSMFQQRSQLIKNFKAMLICGKGNLNQVYQTLKFMRLKFDMLDNSDIHKYNPEKMKLFPYQIWKPYDHLVKDQSKRSGIIQDLFFLTRTLKQGVSLKNIQSLMHVEQDVFDPNKIYAFITQRERNNQLFQSLNLAQGIYVPLIGYIRQIGQNKIQEIHRRLLFSVYQYLTLLCFNNLQAKQILMKFIPDVIPHIGKRVGASSFIYQVSINNKLLVSNQHYVKLIIDGSLKACAQLQAQKKKQIQSNTQMLQQQKDTNDYQKSRIFFSLRGILLYNQDGNKRNQQLLMNCLQDTKYKQFIFLEQTPFIDSLQNFNLLPKQTWVANVFQLLSVIVQSQSFINIGKLQNIYKYQYLLKCLKSTNRWQIRRGIRGYINRLYYVNKDKDIFLFQQFVRSQLTIINKQLADLIQLHKSKMLTDDLKIKNGIRFVYAQSQILLIMIQIMISLHQMFLKKPVLQLIIDQFNKEAKTTDQRRKYHDQILRLLKNLGCISLLYPKTKPISPFVRQIKKLLTNLLVQNMQLRYLERQSDPKANQGKQREEGGQGQMSMQQTKKYQYDQSKSFFKNLGDLIRSLKAKQKMQELKKEYKKKKQQLNMPQRQQKQRYVDLIFSAQNQNLKAVHVKPKQIKQSHYNPHLITTHSKNFKVIARPDFEQNRENIQLNKSLSEVKEMIDDLPLFKKLMDDQFNVLVKTFTAIDSTSESYYQNDWKEHGENTSAIYPLEQIISKKFELIRQNPHDIQDSQKIFLIKLVRCYITQGLQEKQTFKLSVEKWDAEYYQSQTKAQKKGGELQRRQNAIEKCGGSQFLMQIFKENLTQKVQLLNQALLLGIAYLYNGNTQCQNSLLKCLVDDSDNSMLNNIDNLINTIGNFLIQVRMIKENQKKRDFAYKIVDTYDYYSISQHTLEKQFGVKGFDKIQMKTQDSYQKAICRIFRFLQLFCQNNNIDMKKFILIQTNEDGTPKDSTINFVNTACLLLRRLFKVMNNKIVYIPNSVLEFLKEVTQTPCINNQKSLMNSTFFEDISYMAEFFENKPNILSRKFQLNPSPKPITESQQQQNYVPCARDKLMQIYETGISLVLSNFQGNDYSLQYQFISKCKPKYLWLTIRQNLLRLLKARRQSYGIDNIRQDQDDDSRLAKELFKAFSPPRIQSMIQQQRANSQRFGPQVLNILSVFSVIRKVVNFQKVKHKLANVNPQNIDIQQNEKSKKAADFIQELQDIASQDFPQYIQFIKNFDNLILSIEVSSFNGQKVGNQFIHFPKHPVFDFLAGSTKDNIMMNVKRDTSRDKLISLLDFNNQIYSQIQLNYSLKYKPTNIFGRAYNVPITSQLCDKIKLIAKYISFIIIFLIGWKIVVQHNMENQTSQFTYYNTFDRFTTKAICFIQLITTLLYFVIWLMLRLPLAKQKWIQEHKPEQEQQGEQQEKSSQQQNHQAIAEQKQNKKQIQSTPNQIDFTYVLNRLNSGIDFVFNLGIFIFNFLTKVFNWIETCRIYNFLIVPILALFKYQASFNSTISFILAAIMGNIYGVQWYTLHLFDFFVTIDSLANVFKSVLNNIGILTLLSALLGIFTLVFNVISLSTYTHVIYQDDDFPSESCQSIVDCVLVLYTSGAIGGDMQNFQFGRFLFDTGYVVVIQIMFMQIIGGMLMDSYQGLTQEDNIRNHDKKNLCYVCGMKKQDMEKNGQTFNKHTGKHNMWNYVYYIYVLSICKPETQYTGIQYEITNQIKDKMVSWFPSNSTDEGGADIEQLLGNLESKINTISENTAKLTQKNILGVNKGWSKIKKLHDENTKIKEELMNEVA